MAKQLQWKKEIHDVNWLQQNGRFPTTSSTKQRPPHTPTRVDKQTFQGHAASASTSQNLQFEWQGEAIHQTFDHSQLKYSTVWGEIGKAINQDNDNSARVGTDINKVATRHLVGGWIARLSLANDKMAQKQNSRWCDQIKCQIDKTFPSLGLAELEQLIKNPPCDSEAQISNLAEFDPFFLLSRKARMDDWSDCFGIASWKPCFWKNSTTGIWPRIVNNRI